MKKSILFVGVVLLVLGSILFSSFKSGTGVQPSQKVNEIFLSDLKVFNQKFVDFESAIGALKQGDKSATKVLQSQWKDLRLAYKKSEFLVEYLFTQSVKDYINGPPFLKLARNEAGVNIKEPVSMQVLEEMVFQEDPFRIKTEMVQHYSEIKEGMGELLLANSHKITDREVLEAIRFQLIRVFSLGLTGFDVPASENSLKESQIAFRSIKEAFNQYNVPFWQEKEPTLLANILNKFDKADQFLSKQKDFDHVDRLFFLKEYINPLFSEIGTFHARSGIEMYHEVNSLKQTFNYSSTQLFDRNLINRYYFTSLGTEKPSPKLENLGKMLFFDPVLSSNNQRSCASCHKPEMAFTDGKAKSLAMDFKGTVDRNAPTLIDAAYSARQFWDLRANKLEQQAEHVIVSEKEFHTSYDEIINKLAASPEYTILFNEAFGRGNALNKDNFSAALAAYVASLVSFNSPFDRYVRGETKDIHPAVKRGFNLFMGKAGCGTCHFAPVFNGLVPPYFSDSESEVLGVPSDKKYSTLDSDPGRATGQMKERSPIFAFAFKTPTVRNIAHTAPYMHNGVFDTLEEVMEFYNNGGGKGHGLTIPNQTLPEDSLGLKKNEIQDIIAFMNALSDTTGLTSKPTQLPKFTNDEALNKRKVGGVY